MRYVGPLYGAGNSRKGRKIYFDTGKTSEDWDALEARAERAEAELANLRLEWDAIKAGQLVRTETDAARSALGGGK